MNTLRVDALIFKENRDSINEFESEGILLFLIAIF